MANGGTEVPRGRGTTSGLLNSLLTYDWIAADAKVRIPSEAVARWLGRGELETGCS